MTASAPAAGETLATAKERIRLLAGSAPAREALALAERLLTIFPLDDDLRFWVADLLVASDHPRSAIDVYQALAGHAVKAGRPLRALVAERLLRALGQSDDSIAPAIVETYAAGSARLGSYGARPAPFDQSAPVPADALDPTTSDDDEDGDDLAALAARARERALDLSAIPGYPARLPAIPLLSELDPEPLRLLLSELILHRLADGQLVMREGQSGTSFYFLAAGELRVTTSGPDRERQLARLHENSIFGEMALITSQPRVASVRVVGAADVFEVTREALDRLRAQMPAVQQALDRFTRERLIRNLLATSALFTPFSADQQAELLRRFEGIEVDPGAEIIRQGEPGRGLYVVLSGELEVVARSETASAADAADASGPVVLGSLGAADIFGEMSLLTSQPASATVRARSRCNLLFLPRVYVDRLAAAIPEVQRYFSEVAARRAADNSLRLRGAALPEVEIDVELDSGDPAVLL